MTLSSTVSDLSPLARQKLAHAKDECKQSPFAYITFGSPQSRALHGSGANIYDKSAT